MLERTKISAKFSQINESTPKNKIFSNILFCRQRVIQDIVNGQGLERFMAKNNRRSFFCFFSSPSKLTGGGMEGGRGLPLFAGVKPDLVRDFFFFLRGIYKL